MLTIGLNNVYLGEVEYSLEQVEMTDETMKHMKKFFAVKWFIFIVLALSIFFYFILTVVMKKMGIKLAGDAGMLNILQYVFVVLAAIMLAISFFIRRPLNDPELFLKTLKKRDFDPELLERFATKINDDSVKKVCGVVLLSNSIDVISWALCEAVAILGLVLFFLSEDILYVQAFGGAALLAMGFFRPDFTVFTNLIESALKEDEVVHESI